MKKLLLIVLCFWSLFAYPQNGKIQGVIRDEYSLPNIRIDLHKSLEKENYTITYTDTSGKFEFQNVQNGTYDLHISFVGLFHKLENIKVSGDSTIVLSIRFPWTYGDIKKECPYGHNDNTIPIIYRKPKKKEIRKARKGEIVLISNMANTYGEPSYFCKKHEIKF